MNSGSKRFISLILPAVVIAMVFYFFPVAFQVQAATLPCNQGQVLCSGATGPDVKILQTALNNIYLVPQGRGAIPVNCTYDDATKTAVIDYQNDNGLTSVDGMAGPETLGSLGITGQMSGKAPTGGSCTPTTTPPPGGSNCTSITDLSVCANTSGCSVNSASQSCVASATTPPGGTPPAGTPPATGGNGTCGDPRLEQINGICVPKVNTPSGSLASASSLADLIFIVINYLLLLSGLIAVVALIVGGFWYITAAGNEEQSEKGRKAIVNAVIGLIVVLLAYAIVRIITDTLTTKNILQRNTTNTSTTP